MSSKSHVGHKMPGITNEDGTPYVYSIEDEMNEGIAEEEETRMSAKKLSQSASVSDYVNGQEVSPPTVKPRKPRTTRDHSCDLQFYVVHNTPTQSWVVVRQGILCKAVIMFDNGPEPSAFSLPQSSAQYAYALGFTSRRGVAKPFVTMTLAHPADESIAQILAFKLFTTLPEVEQFMTPNVTDPREGWVKLG